MDKKLKEWDMRDQLKKEVANQKKWGRKKDPAMKEEKFPLFLEYSGEHTVRKIYMDETRKALAEVRAMERARGHAGSPFYGSVADSPARAKPAARPQRSAPSLPQRKPQATAPSPIAKSAVPSLPQRKPVGLSDAGSGSPATVSSVPALPQRPSPNTTLRSKSPGAATSPTAPTVKASMAGNPLGDKGPQSTLKPLAPRTLDRAQGINKVRDITTPPVGSSSPKLSTDAGPGKTVSSTPPPRINATSPHTGAQHSVITKLPSGLKGAWNKSVNKSNQLPEAYGGKFSVRKIYTEDHKDNDWWNRYTPKSEQPNKTMQGHNPNTSKKLKVDKSLDRYINKAKEMKEDINEHKIGSRVKISQGGGMKEFHGQTGEVVGHEKDGSTKMYRVRLHKVVDVPGVGKVHSDLWAGEHLKKLRD